MAFRSLVYAALLLPNALGTLVNPLVLQPAAPQAVEWDPLPKQVPEIELSSLSSTDFSIFTHPLYPQHQDSLTLNKDASIFSSTSSSRGESLRKMMLYCGLMVDQAVHAGSTQEAQT
ncbi:6283_t:CDS:2, partial [Acaulospora colombiana]